MSWFGFRVEGSGLKLQETFGGTSGSPRLSSLPESLLLTSSLVTSTSVPVVLRSYSSPDLPSRLDSLISGPTFTTFRISLTPNPGLSECRQ